VLPLSIGLYAMAIGPDVPEQSQRYAGYRHLRVCVPAARNPITRILKARLGLSRVNRFVDGLPQYGGAPLRY